MTLTHPLPLSRQAVCREIAGHGCLGGADGTEAQSRGSAPGLAAGGGEEESSFFSGGRDHNADGEVPAGRAAGGGRRQGRGGERARERGRSEGARIVSRRAGGGG